MFSSSPELFFDASYYTKTTTWTSKSGFQTRMWVPKGPIAILRVTDGHEALDSLLSHASRNCLRPK
eukprot:scaffold30126_cov143-Skeletonema_menzelii.AAC.2